MLPILNMLPAAAEGKGGQLTAPLQEGEYTAETPADGSFGAILAGQEAPALLPAEHLVQNLPVPPVGGNENQPGGNELPLLPVIGGETLAAAGEDAVVLPPTVTGSGLELPGGLVSGQPGSAGSDLFTATPVAPVTVAPAVDTGPVLPATADTVPASPTSGHSALFTAAAGELAVPATRSPAMTANDRVSVEPLPTAAGAGVAAAPAQGLPPVAASALLEPGIVAPAPAPAPNNTLSTSPGVPGGSADSRPLYAGVQGPAVTPMGSPDADQNAQLAHTANLQQAAARQSDPVMAGAGVGLEAIEAMDAIDTGEPGQSRYAASNLAPLASSAALGSALETAQSSGLRSGAMTHPAGHANWNEEFVGRLNLMVNNGVNEARLQLNPAQLGQLDISISTEGDRAVILFNVQSAAAREAIDLAMPKLREMLEQSGLQLAHTEVADQSQSQRGQGDTTGERAADIHARLAAEEEAESRDEAVYQVAVDGSSALVDYYA